jgi:hypothetical protein
MQHPLPIPTLNSEQTAAAAEAFKAYLVAPAAADGRTRSEVEREFDERRVEIIESTLKPLLAGYLDGVVPLDDFKRRIDGINKAQLLGVPRRQGANVLQHVRKRSHG